MASLSKGTYSEQIAIRLGVTAGCLIAWRLLAAIRLPIRLLQPGLFPLSTAPPDRGLVGVFEGSPLLRQDLTAIGLNPFITAFVVFWFWGALNPKIRELREQPASVWRYLAWLTGVLAAIQAISLTAFMVGAQRSMLTSTAGLLTIGALVLGTMALFWLGRLIDEFGIPAGYGVWFLYGAGSLLNGVHHVTRWVVADSGDGSLGLILMAYALISIALLGSTVVAMDLVLPITAQPATAKRERSGRIVFTFHLLQGGFVVPVVLSSTLLAGLLAVLRAFGVRAAEGINIWSLIGPINWAGIAYHAALVVAIAGACLLAMRATVDEAWLANKLRRDRLVIRGVVPGKATVRQLRRLNVGMTIVGALWLALVVDLVPLIFQTALGSSRSHLQVGGGPFVIAAAIFIHAATLARRQIRG